jgi:type II secretory pathway pseudopilin PulG
MNAREWNIKPERVPRHFLFEQRSFSVPTTDLLRPNEDNPRRYGRKAIAFSLIELLVTISVIAILVSLLIGALSRTKERGNRIGCVNNLRQLMVGAQMYADQDRHGYFSTSFHDTNDILSYLHPEFVPSLGSFLCPSTRNWIRSNLHVTNPFSRTAELTDLTAYAGSRDKPGTSYELFGFMNYTPDTPRTSILPFGDATVTVKGVKKSITSVAGYEHYYDSFGLKGTRPSPSDIWLITDGDEPPGIQNFPDENNNHGASGANSACVDGHAAWVRRREFIFKYELSQDENREP